MKGKKKKYIQGFNFQKKLLQVSPKLLHPSLLVVQTAATSSLVDSSLPNADGQWTKDHASSGHNLDTVLRNLLEGFHGFSVEYALGAGLATATGVNQFAGRSPETLQAFWFDVVDIFGNITILLLFCKRDIIKLVGKWL